MTNNNNTNNTITLEEIKIDIAMADDYGRAPEANSLKEVLKEAETILAFSSNTTIWGYLEKIEKMEEVHVLNAFSISMLPSQGGTVKFTPLSSEEVMRAITGKIIVSHIGHSSTAAVIGKDLNINNLYTCRDNFILFNDAAIVAQYVGPRLPEGATELPEGATIKYFMVELN